MADTMIERMARAVAPHLQGGRNFDRMPTDKPMLRAWVRSGEVVDINDATQEDAKVAARDLLTVMRDPTEAMASAGDASDYECSEGGSMTQLGIDPAIPYRAMIGAALEEG